MTAHVIIGFIAMIFASSISYSISTSLMTPDEANQLANQLRTFDDDSSDLLEKTEKLRNDFHNKLPNDQVTLDLNQINFINHVIDVVKYHFQVFEQFNQQYKELKRPDGRFAKITADFRGVEKRVRILDESLYGKLSFFKQLAGNKNPTTNCVTRASSIELIETLYSMILEFEIRKHAIELFIEDMQAKLDGTNTDDLLAREDIMKSDFQLRVGKLNRVVSDAIENANKAIEKCAEQ